MFGLGSEQLIKWAAFRLSAAIAFLFAEQNDITSPIKLKQMTYINIQKSKIS